MVSFARGHCCRCANDSAFLKAASHMLGWPESDLQSVYSDDSDGSGSEDGVDSVGSGDSWDDEEEWNEEGGSDESSEEEDDPFGF